MATQYIPATELHIDEFACPYCFGPVCSVSHDTLLECQDCGAMSLEEDCEQ